MSWDFEENMQVVCIDDKHWTFTFGEITPVENRVYTIRALIIDDEGVLCMRLVEIRNDKMHYGDDYMECMFIADRFRPCKKTDISDLTAILNKVPTEYDIERAREEMGEEVHV